MIKGFDNLISEIANLMQELRIAYVDSRTTSKDVKEIIFATKILNALNNNHQIIAILSKILRKDLIGSIHTHHPKYVKKMQSHPELSKQLEEFNQCFKELKTNLGQEHKIEHNLDAKDFDKLCKLLADIIHKVQGIFAEQNHNEDEINYLIAASIVLQRPGLQFADIEAMISNLLAIKELWALDNSKENSNSDDKAIFLRNISSEIFLTDEVATNKFDVILKVINYLTLEKEVLIQLSDQEILSLYNRVKNDEIFLDSAFEFISNIYKESKFRFSCSRLSDSGYQILEKFQKFESITQQIDEMQDNFMEKYLVSNNYLGHTLVQINKHSENICALRLTNDKGFISLLDKIDSSVRHFKVKGGNPQIKTLENLHNKLSMALGENTLKKYSMLDNFQIEYARRKYEDFFNNAIRVINEEEGFKDYLNKIFNHKLAYDFYLANTTNSVEKIRSMDKDRMQIEQTLNDINLINVFHVFSGNNIHSLDFRKKTLATGIKTPEEYITALVKAFIQECSAFQLEAIYRPLIGKPLNKTEELLKTELTHQIHIRTSVTKMLMSVATGKKKEYKKLKELKKI